MADLKLTLKIWRQNSSSEKGNFEVYNVDNLNTHMSFLEMLDVLNEKLINDDKNPVAFDHDCREGIAECVLWLLMVDHMAL